MGAGESTPNEEGLPEIIQELLCAKPRKETEAVVTSSEPKVPCTPEALKPLMARHARKLPTRILLPEYMSLLDGAAARAARTSDSRLGRHTVRSAYAFVWRRPAPRRAAPRGRGGARGLRQGVRRGQAPPPLLLALARAARRGARPLRPLRALPAGVCHTSSRHTPHSLHTSPSSTHATPTQWRVVLSPSTPLPPTCAPLFRSVTTRWRSRPPLCVGSPSSVSPGWTSAPHVPTRTQGAGATRAAARPQLTQARPIT